MKCKVDSLKKCDTFVFDIYLFLHIYDPFGFPCLTVYIFVAFFSNAYEV